MVVDSNHPIAPSSPLSSIHESDGESFALCCLKFAYGWLLAAILESAVLKDDSHFDFTLVRCWNLALRNCESLRCHLVVSNFHSYALCLVFALRESVWITQCAHV